MGPLEVAISARPKDTVPTTGPAATAPPAKNGLSCTRIICTLRDLVPDLRQSRAEAPDSLPLHLPVRPLRRSLLNRGQGTSLPLRRLRAAGRE